MITTEMIRERIREVIRTSGIQQNVLAASINVTSSTISDYMRKNKLPSLDTLANLCKVLDVSPAYILCFTDEL